MCAVSFVRKAMFPQDILMSPMIILQQSYHSWRCLPGKHELLSMRKIRSRENACFESKVDSSKIIFCDGSDCMRLDLRHHLKALSFMLSS
ncbi:hypothetical protein HMPREF0762_00457 [Slackia exigua ATCC 700122]|uniref:Uncharacterized protein n=1 Tax=Slackia exigua (strain ATCC 700122 / DSM 15923 / CIP 105133 / JCM 11022 / KCTC 5966 / S-7) TaxID=649764 RepID=D0WFD9_SLAES|nr:hypothetical protein HMPREF0762_00457 [Slackia exigua ATCC 700122]